MMKNLKVKKLRYSLIGCGRIAINHIQAYLDNNKDLELVALCDIDTSKAEELIEKFNLEKKIAIYRDYKVMIGKENLDLVVIAVNSGKHAELSIECLRKKINVIVEKPMALSIKDADKMIEIAKKNKVKLCVSHQNRFNKSIQKLRNALETKKFGKLFYGTAHVRWNRNKDYYDQAKWRGTWEKDGGALMNQCIHNIDLLRWMMGGEIEEVFAYTDNLNHGYIEGEDLGLAVIKFKNGSYGLVEGTVNTYPQNLEETLYIFGESGTVKIGGKSVNKIDVWKFNNENEEEVLNEYKENPPNVYGFGHSALYKDMIESIRNDREPYVSGIEGKNGLELVLAIYKSVKIKKPVKLPLKNFSTLNMKDVIKKKHETKQKK